MNKKLQRTIIIWGIVVAILITSAIIYNILKPSTPTPSTEGDDNLYIPLSLLTAEERSHIEATSLAVLQQFLTQSTIEPAATRTARLAPYLTSNSLVPKIPLEAGNSYSSMYALLTTLSATTPTSFYWSEVTATTVTTAATVHVTYTDAQGFTDSNYQNWFVTFQKSGDTWLVYYLEPIPIPDNSYSGPNSAID